VPGYQGPYSEGPQVLKEPYSDGLSSHQLYPGMYFPPQGGHTKNPFNYDFTIGIRKVALVGKQFWINHNPQLRKLELNLRAESEAKMFFID